MSCNDNPVLDAGAECMGCALHAQKQARGYVPGQAPSKDFNGLMLIGEGPGQTEITEGLPFVGASGKLLTGLLNAAGIDRDACWISNSTICLPPRQQGTDKSSFMQRFPLAVYHCQPRLEAEIAHVRPRVIVALGQTALAALTGRDVDTAKRTNFTCPVCGDPPKRSKKCPGCLGLKTQVTMVKEYVTDHQVSFVAGGVFPAEILPSRLNELGVKYVIGTYHPAFLLHKAATKAQAQVGGQFIASAVVAHLMKARSLLTRDLRYELETWITDDPDEVREYTQSNERLYALDIETDAPEPFDVTTIKCVGIGSADRKNVLVVDTREADADLWLALQDFLENPVKRKALQNRFYDEQVLWLKKQIEVRGTEFDTMLGMHSLYPDEPKDLHKIAFRYTDASPWKPPKKKGGTESFESFDELAVYNARDVRNTALAVEPMQAEMHAEGVWQVHEMDMAMTDIALHMQAVGLPLDAERLAEIGVESRRIRDEALAGMIAMADAALPDDYDETVERLESMAGVDHETDKSGRPKAKGTFNPNSHPQLAWALYHPSGPCRLIAPGRTQTGAPATDKSTLAKLSHPFIDLLTSYREHRNIVSMYVEGDGLKPGPDGRIHPKWNVTGARTGRWSSSPNFQNLDEMIRSCIVAPPGRKIVGADMAQLEQRIMAALSGDPELMRRCATADEDKKLYPDHDPHSYIASQAFKRAFTDADPEDPSHTKDPKCICGRCRRKALRTASKVVVYALNYGGGAQRILEIILDGGWSGGPLTLDIVKRLIDTYFAEFPGVPKWRNEIVEEARRTGEVRSKLLKRRRVFPLGDVDITVAYNFPIQSTAADIMNGGLRRLFNKLFLIDPSALILAQVHDAIYVECDEKLAQQVADLVTETLSCSMSLRDGAPEMPFTAKAKIGQTWDAVS